MRLIWQGVGWTSLTVGVIGIVLPLLPTTPFLLLAAWAFSKSSERLHAWLLNHPKLGPPIVQWHRYGVIPNRAKAVAILAISLSFSGMLFLGAPTWALTLQFLVLAAVSWFILTRPSRAPGG
jgi:uncharacterized protein